MTTREPVSTNLILGIIKPLYAMIDEDIEVLRADLERQVRAQYGKTIQGLLTLHGCQQTAQGPDEKASRWIEEYVQEMSAKISQTYNRQLDNEISRLYRENPRSNRFAYIRALDAWTVKRNGYKPQQIALNTMSAARAYAQDRFIRENGLTKQRYAPVGPPPVCKICVRIFAKGALPWDECQKKANYLPSHVNCPHTRAVLVPKKLNCGEAWRG